jgi:hypothetical protein
MKRRYHRLDSLVTGWLLIYTWLAMKRVYGQGWLRTLVKWWTLGWAYFRILLLALRIAVIAKILLL